MRSFILQLIVAFGICFFAAQSFAQDNMTTGADVDFSKATDRQFNESQSFYKHCLENETLSTQHDCRCLSAEYLAFRMSLGDEAPRTEIMDSIRTTCVRDPDAPLPESGKTSLSDFSNAELDEAQEIYNNCSSAWELYTFYDCKCRAARFLDKRHELGPLAGADKIRVSLRDECKNDVEIAGYKYTECMKNAFHLPDTIKPKEYCECYAQEYTKLYTGHTGRLSEKAKNSFETNATGNCRERLTGRRY